MFSITYRPDQKSPGEKFQRHTDGQKTLFFLMFLQSPNPPGSPGNRETAPFPQSPRPRETGERLKHDQIQPLNATFRRTQRKYRDHPNPFHMKELAYPMPPRDIGPPATLLRDPCSAMQTTPRPKLFSNNLLTHCFCLILFCVFLRFCFLMLQYFPISYSGRERGSSPNPRRAL